MSETTIRRKLAGMGFRLSCKTFPLACGYSEKRYAIVDENTVIVTGGFTMSLEDVASWITE